VALIFVSTSRNGALSSDGFVGILIFSGETVFLDVVQGSSGHTSVASHVAIGDTRAINQLLFSEAREFSSGDEEVSFQNTGGRESPARSALTLILNRGNSALNSPVNGVSSGINSEELDGFGGDFRDQLSEIGLLELLISQVEEHGLSVNSFTLSSVESISVFNVVIEDLKSVIAFT